ncbi:MAG TPA: exopolysaccharide biosynthesis protein [Allosphingosinicella sp.]|nr:exopolysaccharide biosynthesis protein [Allosphingosinicella sp.]
MNQHTPLSQKGSLIERAAQVYGFGLSPGQQPRVPPGTEPEPKADRKPETARALVPARSVPTGKAAAVDRALLRKNGCIDPDAPAGALAEELRLVKRQLLLGAGPGSSVASAKRRTILVCSAQPDDGKSFCALNLALSIAAERDREVLLVDADYPKPEVASMLGIEAAGAGLVDALADRALDPESLVVPTDVPGLSILPAGRHESDVPELLASARTRQVLDRLAEAQPNRIVLFDSPPALMASAASVLATHVGQLVMVVRADSTTEADLREAVGLLSGCEHISLLLNGTGFAATGRRFGSYYGYGQ